MKKEKPKASKQKVNTRAQRNTDFDDLGLEPPKIYRDTQAYKKQQEKLMQERRNKRTAQRKSSSKKGNENLTRTERRALETKRRQKKNRLHKLMTWLMICVTILGVGIVLSLTVFFKIGEVIVTGNERYATDEILSQCSIDVGENMFLADTKNAKALLERNLPYIYNANIKRKLPDKIVINITEVEPSYYIQNEDETYILLDDNFKVLETAGEKSCGMQIINAEITEATVGRIIEFADENVASCLSTLAQVIKSNNFTEFTAISSEGLNTNSIFYDGRIEFKLGTTQELEKKIYQGLATCEKLDKSSPNVEGEITLNGGKQIYFTEK